jgi:hypothetical protein
MKTQAVVSTRPRSPLILCPGPAIDFVEACQRLLEWHICCQFICQLEVKDRKVVLRLFFLQQFKSKRVKTYRLLYSDHQRPTLAVLDVAVCLRLCSCVRTVFERAGEKRENTPSIRAHSRRVKETIVTVIALLSSVLNTITKFTKCD